jgi:hypothetical protein
VRRESPRTQRRHASCPRATEALRARQNNEGRPAADWIARVAPPGDHVAPGDPRRGLRPGAVAAVYGPEKAAEYLRRWEGSPWTSSTSTR